MEMTKQSTTNLQNEWYGVCRYDENGNRISLCSIHDTDGSWRYHRMVDEPNNKSTVQYFDDVPPTQEEMGTVKGEVICNGKD